MVLTFGLNNDSVFKMKKKYPKIYPMFFLFVSIVNLIFLYYIKYQNQGLTLGDLINEGNLGLIKAAQRFDVTRGFKFISYAVWWIRQSILQALAEQARIVRLPLNRVGSLSKFGRAFSHLEQQFEREPSP